MREECKDQESGVGSREWEVWIVESGARNEE